MDRRISSPVARRRIAIGTLLLAVAALGYGCFERALKPVNPCTTSVQGTVIQVTNVDKVDLLLMIDNSNSMSEEQASVIREIPRVVTILTSGHDDSGAIDDFTPARSLHIGIVDSDMGLGTTSGIATCEVGLGDDGLMQIVARHPGSGCSMDYSTTYPGHVFAFDVTSGVAPSAFAADVGCVANLGTDGCGFEFELESPLKALSLVPNADGSSPAPWTHAGYRPPVFYMGTYGHGADPATNGSFMRPDSALAIVTINDEDDCSTEYPEIFSPDDPRYSGTDLNLRCHVYPEMLYPISRYAEGFLGLRQNSALLIYAAITGVPPDDSGMDPAQILMDPMMLEQVDPASMGNRLLPACVTGNGSAYPAIRMTQLAQQLNLAGAATTVQSICNASFTPAFNEIIRIVSAALSGACLARELNPDADGNVDCDVLEVLQPIGGGSGSPEHCAELEHPEAYTRDHIQTITATDGSVTEQEVCRIVQVGRAGAGVDPGWAYDDGNAALGTWSARPMGCGQRIGFSVISPVNGAEVRLQCNETILPSSHSAAQLGTPCDPVTGMTTTTTPVQCNIGHAVPGNSAPLACDGFERSCQIPCMTDANCTGAGLLSYVCDTRPASEVFPMTPPMGIMPTDIHHFCVNPTCGQRAE